MCASRLHVFELTFHPHCIRYDTSEHTLVLSSSCPRLTLVLFLFWNQGPPGDIGEKSGLLLSEDDPSAQQQTGGLAKGLEQQHRARDREGDVVSDIHTAFTVRRTHTQARPKRPWELL